jgi:hypothetical protein
MKDANIQSLLQKIASRDQAQLNDEETTALRELASILINASNNVPLTDVEKKQIKKINGKFQIGAPSLRDLWYLIRIVLKLNGIDGVDDEFP